MNKRFFNALLLGAVVLSTGTFVSCDNDDVDDLKSRVSVIEVAIDDIKTQLSKALMTGASITKVDESNGTYTLTLSDGQKIVIKPGGGNISIVVTDTEAIITIEGEEYILPLGSLVNSLIYSPETIDGIVEIGNTATTVNFLARPALKSLDGAEFTIAESHVLTRAADGEQFKVSGDVTLEGDFIKVPIKALGEAEAGKTYAVSLQLNLKGTIIGSNYFTVKVSDDFSSIAEDLGGVTIKADYSPQDLADGFKEMTIKGSDLLVALNFKDLFSELPANAEFVVASSGKQPGGQAQEKQELLSKSLKKDGTWAFSERPGTSFNENADRKGFLINVLADDVVKAKIYVCINDELADVDFASTFNEKYEGEWGGRTKSLALGAQVIDIQNTFTNWEEDYAEITHRGKSFLENWANANYQVQTADGETVLFCDGNTLVMDDIAKKYAQFSRGIYWYFRGISILVPEAYGKWMNPATGKEVNGGDEIVGGFNDAHREDPEVYEAGFAKYGGVTMDQKTGKITLNDTYTGYGFRFAIAAVYEYAYGWKKLHKADQFGFFFFNRRVMPEGTTIPE